jgi:hypothetical protein
MTTWDKCVAAAKRRWGKKFRIEDCKRPSSVERRAAALAIASDANKRCHELREEQKAIGSRDELNKTLREKARFVVDVDGDAPSIEQLEAALLKIERHATIDEEYFAAKREKTGDEHYYRYKAGDVLGGPFSMFCVLVEADTLDELLTKIRNYKKSEKGAMTT